MLFVPAKEDIHSQVSPIFLFLLAFQHCHYFQLAVSCHCYDILEHIFQVQHTNQGFSKSASSCPCLGFYTPKCPKKLGELLRRKIPAFPAWCWRQKCSCILHGNFFFEYCRSFDTTLQLRMPWPRGEHGDCWQADRCTQLAAGDWSRTHQSEWKDGLWLWWGLDQIPVEKYSCCELYTAKFHL